MAKYDIVDEEIIAATPAEIIRALEDEAAGRSQWWLPTTRMRQRGTGPVTEVGTVLDITINSRGHLDRRWGTARFTGRVTAVEPQRRIVVTYFDGDFRGTAEWTFDPMDEEHTRIAMHWVTRPHGAMRLWVILFDVPRHHSMVMRQTFRAIEGYVADVRSAPRT